MVLHKHDLEAALHAEKRDISSGKLKEDNPLDLSDSFETFCEACRRGDLKVCQEKIIEGVNINARDRFDYTPLILASLCGHFEVVQLLLESGALCERDTFQGERCLYDAHTDRIKNLLLSYDFSKSTNPLQPLAGHITSLLAREEPDTSDITLSTYDTTFRLHKFVLSARSPYFAQKLAAAPETTSWKLSQRIPTESFQTAIRYLYLGEVTAEFGHGDEEQQILTGIDKVSKHLEIERLLEVITDIGDRRLTRQRRTDEVTRGRDQFAAWFQQNVLKHKVSIAADRASDVKWDRDNSIFADVLLRADEPEVEDEDEPVRSRTRRTEGPLNGIPIGMFSNPSRSPSRTRKSRKSVLYPVHRAMLLRSEFFNTMFCSGFQEAQQTPHLQIIPVDCTPEVLEIVLTYLYTEKADFGLDVAVEVLFAADLLFIDKLKQRAAQIISTLGNGSASVVESDNSRGETEKEDVVDIYEVIRAGWDTRVHRLEEFGARYIAYRLERFIDDPEFAEIVKESAARIQGRQETDTVELIDDIRHYLSQRFWLRMEESGMDELMEEKGPEESLTDTDKGDGAQSNGSQQEQTNGHLVDETYLEPGVIRTLDGDEIDSDEMKQDAIQYQVLNAKIDELLDNLHLDA